MEILDEKGRLFGVVNVIDALAVLLVLAVVAAGAALVLGSEPEPEPEFASTHATLDLGTQPDYIVAQLNEGDGRVAKRSRLCRWYSQLRGHS